MRRGPWNDRDTMPTSPLHEPVLGWYSRHARELPWRRSDATPWEVFVSEIMLQQTPVARVTPAWLAWLARWPTPAALAADPAGEALRMWGRLGYPRRALRLHAAAAEMVERHGGVLPTTYAGLRSLPGVGDYTAAAVASFAFGARHVVLDTNVRRVLARSVGGVALPGPSVTAAERQAAESLLPDEPAVAARWAIAVMELGALLCTAASPSCGSCPVAGQCAWLAAGFPAYAGPVRRAQAFAGTDRQVRGKLMAVVRDADGPVGPETLQPVWAEEEQRDRALASLVTDGLLVADGGAYRLP